MCLSWQNSSFVMTELFHDKHTFVATKVVFCRNKHVFVVTKVSLSWQNLCHNKHMFFMTNMSLSWQKFCRDKNYTCCSSNQLHKTAQQSRAKNRFPEIWKSQHRLHFQSLFWFVLCVAFSCVCVCVCECVCVFCFLSYPAKCLPKFWHKMPVLFRKWVQYFDTYIVVYKLHSNWILTSYQLWRVTLGQSNCVIIKHAFQNSSHT